MKPPVCNTIPTVQVYFTLVLFIYHIKQNSLYRLSFGRLATGLSRIVLKL